jgi:hypothetical protein
MTIRPFNGKEKLTEADLVYAAFARCPCGAGLAHIRGCGASGYWDCSEILLGRAKPITDPDHVQHTAQLPFIFWEVLAEKQPSAKGATTRPPAVQPQRKDGAQ